MWNYLDPNVHLLWTRSKSPLMKQCRSISNRIYSPSASIRKIMESLFEKPIIKLTTKQDEYARKYKVDFSRIWKTIHSLPVSCKVKSIAWQIYSKTLPLFHKDKTDMPHLESTMGIFFGSSAQKLHEEIQLLANKFLGCEITWSSNNVLPLSPNPSLTTVFHVCIFWGLWCFRNKAKYDDDMSPGHFIQIVRNEWVHSLNKMSYELAKSSPTSFQIGPFWLTPTPH